MRRMTFNAADLDKFVFISGDFGFVGEVIEQASKHKPWSEIVKTIESNGAFKPILIFDSVNVELYFGAQENDTLYLQNLYANQGYTLEIQYDYTTDKLTIISTEENYILSDNLKTLFGQSIEGTGDINMYRHELFINGATFIIYSPNQLNINSPQSLTTVVKPDNFSIFMGAVFSTDLPPATVVLYYDNGIWKINDGSVTNVTTIKDHVIPL